MKIGIVETSAFGGLLHYAKQLGDALARRENRVEVISPRDNELAGSEGDAYLLDVLLAPSAPSDQYPRSAVRRFRKRAAVAVRLAGAWIRIIGVAIARRYDVVMINSPIYDPVAAVGVLILTYLPRGPRVVGIVHNARPLAPDVQSGVDRRVSLLERLVGIVMGRFDLILVHGDRSKKELESSWPHRAVASIPHGDERVFADDPPEPSGEPRILLFGEWNWAKGIPVLMDAFDRIAPQLPDAKVTLAGMPDPRQVDLPAIRAWAERHGDRVELLEGYVPIEDVQELFGRARVVAIPYVAGYQSGVVHLAMTMARAVVCTDVGDLAEAVENGYTGLVVPAGDAAALADALKEVLTDAELAARMGEAGRSATLAESSWEQVSERVETLLETLISDKGRLA